MSLPSPTVHLPLPYSSGNHTGRGGQGKDPHHREHHKTAEAEGGALKEAPHPCPPHDPGKQVQGGAVGGRRGDKGVLRMELFEDSLGEVIHEGVRYIVRLNTMRQKEFERTREAKLQRLEAFVSEENTYLAHHRKADPDIAARNITTRIAHLKMDAWVRAVREGWTVQLVVDEKARTGVAALDGCYVIKSDVPRDKAHRETLHARYKDLASVERDFRDMKTAHLDERRSRYLAALGVTLPKRLVSPKRAHVR